MTSAVVVAIMDVSTAIKVVVGGKIDDLDAVVVR